MTTTICFNLNDPRLTSEQKRRLLDLSRNLYAQSAGDQPRQLIDPRAQEAQHHRVDRGDL